MLIEVDAREAPRRVFKSRLVLPAKPGPLTLVYPKWIPGEHGPSGPINGIVGLRCTSNDQPIEWRRDDVDMFAFHLTVPKGASQVEVAIEYLSPTDHVRFTGGPSTTENLAMLNWNQVLLYPKGRGVSAVRYEPSVRLPEGWSYGTALEAKNSDGGRITFAPVTLETLIDSPVLTGRYFRTVALTGGDPPEVQIDIACDGEAGLAMSADLEARYRNLVTEADALFGDRPFRRYRFLLVLSNHVSHFGIEHHESSDNRVPERSLVDEDLRLRMAGLLPHEYVHAWNGKYRRPAGLATPDYEQPMRGELLWVYEGLTQYLGYVLMSRSGLVTPSIAREHLADVGAYLDQRPGRTWRPLRDTAVSAQIVFNAPGAGEEARRAADFYNEGLLVWLDADVVIRQASNGTKSLDDFCKRFFGEANNTPRVRPYTFDDLVANLNAVVPHDWKAFLNERLDSTAPRAPLGGIANGGWKLAFTDSIPQRQRLLEDAWDNVDLRYSIGLRCSETGQVSDVVPGLPAALAGIEAGATLVAVNGRKFGRKVVRDALRASANRPGIELLVQDGEMFKTHAVDWKGGERYPRLERDPSRPDHLASILAPQATSIATRGRSASAP